MRRGRWTCEAGEQAWPGSHNQPRIQLNHLASRPAPPKTVKSMALAPCQPGEEKLIFLDGQVRHGAHTALMGNYLIKVEIIYLVPRRAGNYIRADSC